MSRTIEMHIPGFQEGIEGEYFRVKRLHPDAQIPFWAMDSSVGMDISAYLKTETGRSNTWMIPPRTTRKIPTGVAVMAPRGHFILCCSRSGMAEGSLFVANSPGVIDPDYTGEIIVLLFNGSDMPQYIKHEDRIAQLVVLPISNYRILEVSTLPKTGRGDKGFGSTGE
jgi:dUTP pyrophosphatase